VKNKWNIHLVLLVLLSTVSIPLLAHHGNAAYVEKALKLKGTVTAWTWINPHVFLKIDVKDDDGNIVHWTGELVAPSNLVNSGFTKETFKPGDEVTMVTNYVAKTGAPVCRVSEIILANGQVMKPGGGNDGSRDYGVH
jgi:Family of unknown function (DUF6152)